MAGLLDEQRARTLARRQQGLPAYDTPNPFPWLMDKLGSGVESVAEAGIPAIGAVRSLPSALLSGALQNRSEHPLYGNQPQPQGSAADNSPEAMNARVMQMRQAEAEQQKLQEIEVNAVRKQVVQQAAEEAANQAGQQALKGGLTPQTTLAEIDTAKKESQKAKMEVEHQAKVQEGAEAILKSGGTEKELQGWAKFTDEYDLATIGMALMAGQSGNFGTDLGIALMMGKQAADFRKDSIAAGEAAARKENREERKIEIDAYKAQASAEAAKSNALATAANAHTNAQNAATRIAALDVSSQNALLSSATRLEAARISKSGKELKPSQSQVAEAQLMLGKLMPDADKEKLKAASKIMAEQFKVDQTEASAIGEDWNPAMTVDRVTKEWMGSGMIKDTSTFGGFFGEELNF